MINIRGRQWNELTAVDIEKAIEENDESFFFEYKEDAVQPKKLIEEISAFANTYGGYIFVGVADDKKITGCSQWNEQRIHITIHESMSPVPSCDIKRFVLSGNKVVFVIKVDEGLEPPYMTSKGTIYERLSSGSFAIKDSSKLTQMYFKREDQLRKIANKLKIPFTQEKVGNIYGYIDVGFDLRTTNIDLMMNKFYEFDIQDYLKKEAEKGNSDGHHITRCGNTIVFHMGGLSTERGALPAHVNNFVEYMADGSVKFRTLIMKNDTEENHPNMIFNLSIARTFASFYNLIFGDVLLDVFVGAKKYEELTCITQFYPRLYYGDCVTESKPDLIEKDLKIKDLIDKYMKYASEDTVLTNNRIPKNGFYNIDQSSFDQNDFPRTKDNLIEKLFESSFFRLGMVPGQENI